MPLPAFGLCRSGRGPTGSLPTSSAGTGHIKGSTGPPGKRAYRIAGIRQHSSLQETPVRDESSTTINVTNHRTHQAVCASHACQEVPPTCHVGGKAGRPHKCAAGLTRLPAIPPAHHHTPVPLSFFSFFCFGSLSQPRHTTTHHQPAPCPPPPSPLCPPHQPQSRSLTTTSQRSGEGVVNDRPHHARRALGAGGVAL
jgi:hypothetical protein